jgi:putative aldouronate transport system permease protein
MTLVALFCVLPFFLLLGASLTSENEIIHQGYAFIPSQIDLSGYRYVLNGANNILHAYLMSVIVMLIGTAVNLTITMLFAYPLSRKDIPGRNFFNFALFFTLLFSGGLIPSYIMWTQTFHIKNTIFALIVPNLLLNGFYVIMARNYFSTSIPDGVLEAARIDGANELTILTRVVLPLSKPIIATLGLFVSLNYWNDWLNGLYYVSEEKLYTIQVLLNRMLMETMYLKSSLSSSMSLAAGETIPTETIKMTVAVLGVLPLLLIYPFISRYLTSGIVIGAVKE